MKIKVGIETATGFSGGSTELSYLDILSQLKEDLDSDVCMPKADHDKAEELIKNLFNVLYKYSY